jgi:hypothetical protein
VVHAQAGEVEEQVGGHKWQVASDDDGPFTIGGIERSMKTAECTPLWINVGNSGQDRIV